MERYDLLIKNGTLVLEDCCRQADLGIRDGKIAKIGCGPWDQAERVMDAAGIHVFPGAIDTHCHTMDPGPLNFREDWASVSWAAASGGFTCLIDMPNIDPPIVNLETLELKKETAGNASVVDFAFWGAGILRAASHVGELRRAGCAAFKAFTSDAGPAYPSLGNQEIVDMMEIVRDAGGIMAFHAEDLGIVTELTRRAMEDGRSWNLRLHEQVRPYYAELQAIQSILLFAAHTGCPVHICHLSIPEGAQAVREARERGVDVTVESCAHYFLFNYEDQYKLGPFAKIMPPLRSRERSDYLWEFLKSGAIDYLGTDHGPYPEEEKIPADRNYWNAPGGAPSIDAAWPAMLDEAIHRRGMKPWEIARVTSLNAARRFGLYPQKGSIREGADADLALVNLDETWVYSAEHSLCKTKCPRYAYEGRSIRAKVTATLVRGTPVWENGRIRAESGYGRFVPSKTAGGEGK